ncbi:MAG: hypothetical protein ABJE95_34780 [Byssovorax sp.]
MSVKGWLVHLPSPSYSTPARCASCLGPKETEIAVQATSKSGNIRTTLTMRFPYCTACAQRAGKEKIRGVGVFFGAMLIGAAFALAFAFANVFVGLYVRTAIAAILAIPAGFALARLTRPPMPPLPATSRGEAIFLRNTSGTVLCTNEQFANALAQANGRGATPGSKWMDTEGWSVFAVILGGGLAIAGFAAWAPGSMFEPDRPFDPSSYSPGSPMPRPPVAPLRPRR